MVQNNLDRIIVTSYKCIRWGKRKILRYFSTIYTKLLLKCNGVSFKKIICFGCPIINVSLDGVVKLGDKLTLRSFSENSDTGENRPCKIIVHGQGRLSIGDNVGITSSLINCWEKITIANNVKIGGGSQIFDTNFHSIKPSVRNSPKDQMEAQTRSIFIDDNVFIGTSCIIGKGISIGKNSIVAAGSVVTKNIPPNEVWGGNPAQFIKTI